MLNFFRREPSVLRSWIVFIASTLFFFYMYFLMSVGGAINGDIEKEFGFNAKQLSELFSMFTLGNAIFLLPAGLLVDRVSVRYVMMFMFSVAIGAMYIFSQAHGFPVMQSMRFIVGICGAFCFNTAIKVAANWLEARYLALATGIMMSVGMLGGLLAQTPMMLLTNELGWRLAIKVAVGVGVILLIIQFLIVRDAPKKIEHKEEESHEKLEKVGFWRSLWLIISNLQNWLGGLYISFINLPIFIWGSTWGIPYLVQGHNFNRVDASEINSMIFFGILIGSPLVGVISDKLNSRKIPMIIAAVVSIVVMTTIMYTPSLSFGLGTFLYLILGIAVGTQCIVYPLIAASNSLAVTGTAVSLASVVVLASGSLVKPYSWLLERANDVIVIDGTKLFTHAAFHQANWLILGSLILSLVMALLVREIYGANK